MDAGCRPEIAAMSDPLCLELDDELRVPGDTAMS